MCMVIAENAGSLHVWNVDNLQIDRYNYKKPKSTDAFFAKSVFYHPNLLAVAFIDFWYDTNWSSLDRPSREIAR